MNESELTLKKLTKLSLEELYKIEEGTKNGLSCGKIADSIGRSKNTIVVLLRTHGRGEDFNAQEVFEKRKETQTLKVKKQQRDEHIKPRLIKLFEEGFTRRQIRAHLYISWATLNRISNELGICFKEAEVKLLQRIELLEDAMQILTEQIENLHENYRNK